MRDYYLPNYTRRLKAGWAIANTGGNIRAFARSEGVTVAAISRWLTVHNLDTLRSALKSGRYSWGLKPEAENRRAQRIAYALKANLPMRRVAEAEGVSDAAISYWRQKNWTLVDDYLRGEAA